MISFFIKKAFFDGWGNLLGIFCFNIVYIMLTVLGVSGFAYLGASAAVLGTLSILLLLLVISILMGGTASVVLNYSNYERDSWSAFRSGIVRNIRHSLVLFFFLAVFVINIFFTIPFYMGNYGILGIVVSVVLIWLEVLILLCLPYYFPLMNLLPADRPLKTVKKCLIIIADNLGFTIFFLFYNAVCLALTIFTLGLIPGTTGMQLASQDAVKLLMFKHDWMEENPDADKKHVPWADLLFDEKEKVGPRSLKNMIFPWK